MIQAVGEDRVGPARERRQDREVGKIAGRERKCARAGARAHECSELVLERRMRREMTADEMRRAGACAPARRAFAHRRDHLRMTGEPEIIVAREGDELAAVDDEPRALRRFQVRRVRL